MSLVHTKVTQTEQAPVDLIAAMDRDGKITTLTQLEALKLTATEAFEEAGEEFEEHLLNVPRIVLEAIAPQAKQTKVLLNLNIRKNIYTLLVEYSDKHEVTPQRRELLGRIATELLEFTIFKHAEDKAREIYRARLRQGEEAAIDSLIELYENGELLDKLGGGSTQLEVVLSFGFAS